MLHLQISALHGTKFKCPPCHLLTLWFRESYLTALNLIFVTSLQGYRKRQSTKAFSSALGTSQMCDEVQGRLPQHVPLWQADVFEPETITFII